MNTFPPANAKVRSKIIEPGSVPMISIPEAVRVGSVPYLNALPLTRFLKSPVTRLEPTKLSAELRAGRLDVALVPVMEVLEVSAGTYRVVDRLAIGSEREVYSVYLNYGVPLAKVKTVALDPASKTSAELARIVLEKFYRLKPRYVNADKPADAQLLIGDPAIVHRQRHPEQNYLDLATAWREHTGLPFVFAVWALRTRGLKAISTAGLLRNAGRLGVSWRGALGRNAFERRYLKEHLCYDLGARQKKAISLFGEMLAESGRMAVAPKISYV